MTADFRPLQAAALQVTTVGDLTAEQVAAITRPFSFAERVKPVATLSSFPVVCDLSGVLLPEHYRLAVYVWVRGSASQFARLSYNPIPARPLRSKLWRLDPGVTGGEADDTDSVEVTLPRALPVARLAVAVSGLVDTDVLYTPLPNP